MELPSFTFIPPASQISIIIAFAIIGFWLKYIDDAFDENVFSKKIAILVAPILVILWTYLSIFDSISATILFSILFAVLLSGKVDNLIFKLSSIALIVVLFLTQVLNLSLIPLFALTVMGVADEKGNDYVDTHKTYRVEEFFFSHRCCMKVGTIGLCVASLIPWLYLIAFLAFDTAYEFGRIFKYVGPKLQLKRQKISTRDSNLEKIKMPEKAK